MANLTPDEGTRLRAEIVLAIAGAGAHQRSQIITGGHSLIIDAHWPADVPRLPILTLGNQLARLLGADTPFDLRLTSHHDRTVLRIESPYQR